jgi:hypothetical protein
LITRHKNKVNVKLACGYSVDIYKSGLTDDDYIKIAIRFKKEMR